MSERKLAGVWAAVITPINEQMTPDASKAISYYGDLLRHGCNGLNVLGTTGEAMSFNAVQRLGFMESVAGAGLPMERIMVGTGAASLEDAAFLTRAAFETGFAAALVMPPFFFRDAPDDGIVRFFDALIARSNVPHGGLLLYNFPRMSGITFSPDLVDRLIQEFPGSIAGLKDSSNDESLQREIIARHPDLAIFPGSEGNLSRAIGYGAAGCISGSVCLWPQLAGSVFSSDNAELAAHLTQLRDSIAGQPLTATVRYLTAKACADAAWERPMPPNVALSVAQKHAIDAATAADPGRM